MTVATISPSSARPCARALPAQLPQRADGRRALARAAEGEEVVLAQQGAAGAVHRLDIEGTAVTQHVPAQRVMRGRAVGEPIAIPAPQGPEAGIELQRDLAGGVHDDVAGQNPREPGHERLLGPTVRTPRQGGEDRARHVEMADLAAGVDAGVGAAGDGDAQRHAGDLCQGPLELALHGGMPRLRGPAVVPGAVIGEVQPQPRGRRRIGAPSYHLSGPQVIGPRRDGPLHRGRGIHRGRGRGRVRGNSRHGPDRSGGHPKSVSAVD